MDRRAFLTIITGNIFTLPLITSSAASQEDAMKEVQRALKDKGYEPGPIDGRLGPKTKDAVKAFQTSQKIPSTGKVDETTATALGVPIPPRPTPPKPGVPKPKGPLPGPNGTEKPKPRPK